MLEREKLVEEIAAAMALLGEEWTFRSHAKAALTIAEAAFARHDVLEVVRSLPTDEARTDLFWAIFDKFCQHCGGEQPPDEYRRCQCSNDE